MAITGSGTQADPWKVHSYDELKTVTTDRTYLPIYGKAWTILDADINCNDYGANFEWETINLGFDGTSHVAYGAMSFDLNGHEIKNIAVKNNNALFDVHFSASNSGDAEFKGNGKILNVFTQNNSSSSLIIGRYGNNKVSNLSMSVHLGNYSKSIFKDIAIEKCSIYAETIETTSQQTDAVILSWTNQAVSGREMIKNCDIYVKIDNMHTCLAYATNGLIAADSRFRGKISNQANSDFVGYMVYAATNSVIAIDATGMLSSLNMTFLNTNLNTSGVIDTTVKPAGTSDQYWAKGLTACTTEEITTGAELREKGFYVINVSGD